METQEQKPFGITAKETDKPEYGELIKKEEIAGTPFKWITAEDKTFLTLGQYRLTGNIQTQQEITKITKTLKNTDWEIMCALIGAIVNQTIQTYKGEL